MEATFEDTSLDVISITYPISETIIVIATNIFDEFVIMSATNHITTTIDPI
jgi:hypothetical protein